MEITGFNRALVNGVRSLFYNIESGSYNDIPYGILLNYHNVFNLGLKIDTRDDTFEIPIIGGANFIQMFISSYPSNDEGGLSFSECNLDEIIFPLFSGGISYTRRTFDSIIKVFFFSTDLNDRLRMITTNKGGVFYGGRGIILDKDFIPLLLCNLEVKKIKSGALKGNLLYNRPILRINPIVFERDDLICKGIVKKLIPLFSKVDIFLPPDRADVKRRYKSIPAKIIVEDFSNFFVKPSSPSSADTINEDLSRCLEEHIDEVLNKWG